MLRHIRHGIVPALGLTLVAAGWAVRAQDPPPAAPKTTTEKIKESVGGAVGSLKRGATAAEEAIKNQFARAKDTVTKMNVEARVYARIHWDKALAGSKIELSAPKTGVIALHGTVPDAKTRAKAIELTTDTVGVTEVLDQLIVATTSEATPAATPKP